MEESKEKHDLETHKLSDLIVLIENLKKTHGDLPIVYWDQHSSVLMKEKDLVVIHENKAYFGGFHVNGIKFRNFTP